MNGVNQEQGVRVDGRLPNQIRSIDFSCDALGYASASIFYVQGNTKVLASVTLQQGLPHFLKGQPTGWLTAEYAMLPSATHQRTNRESSGANRNPRSVEISRLIGRCLRMCIDLDSVRDKTITIDCDVLQADGGTRVACITAASLALQIACQRWHEDRILSTNPFRQRIAAISVGVVGGVGVADLCYEEDCNADADFNVIVTEDGKLVEIQGTAEKQAVDWAVFDGLKALAQDSIKQIVKRCNELIASPDTFEPSDRIMHANYNQPRQPRNHVQQHKQQQDKQQQLQQSKPGLFSIGNRITKS